MLMMEIVKSREELIRKGYNEFDFLICVIKLFNLAGSCQLKYGKNKCLVFLVSGKALPWDFPRPSRWPGVC